MCRKTVTLKKPVRQKNCSVNDLQFVDGAWVEEQVRISNSCRHKITFGKVLRFCRKVLKSTQSLAYRSCRFFPILAKCVFYACMLTKVIVEIVLALLKTGATILAFDVGRAVFDRFQLREWRPILNERGLETENGNTHA